MIRLCHPHDITMSLQYYKGSKFTGSDSQTVNSLISYIKRDNLNVTIKHGGGPNERINNSDYFTSCIGQLQRNESDVVLVLEDYPMKLVNVTQGYVAFETFPQFISFYKSLNSRVVGHVLSSFDSFTPDTWFLVLLTVMTMYLLKRIRFHLHGSIIKQLLVLKNQLPAAKKNRYYFYQLITHLTRIGSLSQVGLFDQIIFITGSIFSILVIQYFFMWMKTDLVAIKQPSIYKSYDDLIDNQVVIYFRRGFNVENKFRDAQIGSRERYLWDFSLKRIPDLILMDQGDERVMHLNALSIQRKAVVMLNDVLALNLLAQICGLRSMLKQFVLELGTLGISEIDAIYPVISQDPFAQKIQKGVIFSQFFTGNNFKKLTKRLMKYNENGFTIYSIEKFKKSNTDEIINGLNKEDSKDAKDVKRDCKSGKIIQSGKQVDRLQFVHLVTLIYLELFFILIASIICLFECYFHWFFKPISK